MKLWKKAAAVALAAIMSLTLLTACGRQMMQTEDFVHMVQRNLQKAEASSTGGQSGLNLKVKAGEDYRKQADFLLNKYVDAYEAWRATDPVLENEEPDVGKFLTAPEVGVGCEVWTYASKGKSNLITIQMELNDVARSMADGLWRSAYMSGVTEKTITVAEKEVNGWYYLVAVSYAE